MKVSSTENGIIFGNIGEYLVLLKLFFLLSLTSLHLRPVCGRRGGLVVSAPDSGSRGPGSSSGQGHCVVF